MATPQPAKKSLLKETDFLTQLITGVGLALWVIIAEIGKLNPYFVAEIAVILFLGFIASILYRDYTGRKFDLATLQANLQSEGRRQFTTEVQASSLQRANLEARNSALEAVAIMLRETLQDTTISGEKRAVYDALLIRVTDMQRTLYGDPFELRFRRSPSP
jgi:hypothetical protein